MIDINFNLDAAIAHMDNIKMVADEAIRPAAQAGAQVFYEEVKLNAKRGNEVRHLKGKDASGKGRTRPAGLLAASIYQVYSKDNSDNKHATYHVSWNKKKAPHGHLVEFGSSRAAKAPFLRPAYDAMHAVAEAVVLGELEKRLKAGA